MKRKLLLVLAATLGASFPLKLSAADPPPDQAPIEDASDIGWLDLDELAQIKVSTVARKDVAVGKSAAAIHVITSEDIRRSGVTSIQEALRMAPGVDVARIDSRRHAISIRGLNSEFSNKLLVLQDGRSLYTPSFGGVFWNAQDYALDDIERIEVVRGPGGTAWGGQRRQRRDQHHHQRRRRHPGNDGQGGRRHLRAGLRHDASRRPDQRPHLVPRLPQGLQPRRHDPADRRRGPR